MDGSQAKCFKAGRTGKMNKIRSAGDRISELRKSRGETQEKFAEVLEATQPMVSAWEGERDSPPLGAYVRLGNMAPYPDNLWFWEQAGMDREAMVAATKKLRRERRARPAPGEVIRVPRFRETPQGRESAGPPIPLPTEFIPHPDSTVCLLVDNRSARVVHSPKAVFILDESQKDASNLLPFWGQVVFLRYRPESGTEPNPYAPPGIYMGRMVFIQPTEPTGEMIFWAGARLTLLSGPSAVGYLPVGRFEYAGRGDLAGIDPDYAKALEDPRIPSVRAKVREQALRELKLDQGWRVLGRVLGRLKLEGVENG